MITNDRVFLSRWNPVTALMNLYCTLYKYKIKKCEYGAIKACILRLDKLEIGILALSAWDSDILEKYKKNYFETYIDGT